MLCNLSDEIRDCYEHAEACARKAATAYCQQMRDDYLALEESWLDLARSYEFAEQIIRFSDELKHNGARWHDLN